MVLRTAIRHGVNNRAGLRQHVRRQVGNFVCFVPTVSVIEQEHGDVVVGIGARISARRTTRRVLREIGGERDREALLPLTSMQSGKLPAPRRLRHPETPLGGNVTHASG